MNSAVPPETCLLLNAGIVARGSRCLAIMKNLQSIQPSGLRLVAVANVQGSSSCCRYAKDAGIEVFEDYLDLLSVEHLDLVLELTGDEDILRDILHRKPNAVGVLDRQASMRLIDMAQLYAQVDRREADAPLDTPLASTLLEASPDGVLVIDREYRILNCNKSHFIPESVEENALLGKHCFQVLQRLSSPCDSIGIRCPAQQTWKTGRLARSVYEIPGPDNTVQIRQGTAYPIFSRSGEVTQVVLAIRDVTEELSERIEEHTQAIKKDLARAVQEERLTSLGRLVASVCHEINNPITSIVTFTKLVRTLLQRGNLSAGETANVDRYLDLSFREAMRCGSIVKNLLTFARPRNVEAKTMDVHELVNTILLLTGHQLELSEVRPVVDLPPPPFNAWGDYSQIQQCLLNLIFNAIDAMPGGGTMTIAGTAEKNADHIWLTVSDTGHGIEPQDLPRIFEPFYSTKTDGKGSGLGLSMVYGIVREHKGVVEVESEPGRGTTFRIRLPVTPGAGRGTQPVPDLPCG